MLEKIANTVRGLSADGVEAANSGHPGMPIGCADIGAVLFGEVMNYDPERPDWPDRDRFVLSAGHGSMFLYSYLHLAGYDLSLDDLRNFRQLDSKTPGHPEHGETEGVETTTGPLGQGFANAVGMAMAERMMAARYNTAEEEVIDHYTYTIMGDGDMMEGITTEAASLAGHLGLGKLIAIYDDNDISIAGSTELAFTEDVGERFRSFGWHVIEDVDGHDFKAIKKAIKKAKKNTDQPTLVMARTRIAYGAPEKEGTSAAHGAPLGPEEVRGLKKRFGLPLDEKFYVPDEVRDYFHTHVKKLSKKRKKWEQKFKSWQNDNPQLAEAWDKAAALELPEDLEAAVEELEIETPVATRKASGTALRKIAEKVDYLVGGSADLAPSTKTYLEGDGEVQKDDFAARNFRFGVREHAMGGIVNGISLHGGLRPFAATFLVFSDYMRPSIRLAAIMKQPVIYVFTHDSIYVGEDGPTHQPVEHVESLRIIPGLKVLRPGDAEEAKAAWLEAVKSTDGPTALILTRQSLPALKKVEGLKDFSRGGYIIKQEPRRDLSAVLMASGSEVSLAVDVAEILEKEDHSVRVVSVPDRVAFAGQDETYQRRVLGPEGTFRVALEVGNSPGWYQLLGENSRLISMTGFGASGPGNEVAEKFGFVAEKIAGELLEEL
ncbi:MAG: transketolase [Halanaerobiaceae bacterium]